MKLYNINFVSYELKQSHYAKWKFVSAACCRVILVSSHRIPRRNIVRFGPNRIIYCTTFQGCRNSRDKDTNPSSLCISRRKPNWQLQWLEAAKSKRGYYTICSNFKRFNKFFLNIFTYSFLKVGQKITSWDYATCNSQLGTCLFCQLP